MQLRVISESMLHGTPRYQPLWLCKQVVNAAMRSLCAQAAADYTRCEVSDELQHQQQSHVIDGAAAML